MNIYPKFDRVLIKRETLQEKTSLIVIPKDIDERNASERGEVIEIGPTVGVYKNGELIETIKVGSKVIFGKHAGVKIEIEDETFWIIQDTDILAEYK